MKQYIKLMRPYQWIKNFFVFGAIIFSYNFFNIDSIIKVLITFVCLCLISSSVYIMNDIIDVNKDREHLEKKNRPIASGKISISKAFILMLVLLVFSLSISFILNWRLNIIIYVYFINNVLYSFKIKNIVLLDVISIAIGFILRIIAGGIVIDVKLSSWLLLCTLFISLFLGLEKRKGEITALKENSTKHRKSLEQYSINMINDLSNIVCAGTIVFYALYTVLAYKNQYMIVTNIFVIYGIFRYKYLSETKGCGNPTKILLTDKGILFTSISWIIVCILVLMLMK